MTTIYMLPIVRMLAFLALLLFSVKIFADAEVVEVNVFKRREFDAPVYKDSRIHLSDKDKVFQYMEAQAVGCEDGGSEGPYEVLVYVLNTGNAPLNNVEVPFSAVLVADGRNIPSKDQKLRLAALAAGEATVLKVSWSLGDVRDNSIYEQDFKSLSLVFKAGSPGHEKTLKLPFVVCE